jgi:hypothetical protein
MTLELVEWRRAVILQGRFAEATLDVIDRMINNMVKTTVIFLVQANYWSGNS